MRSGDPAGRLSDRDRLILTDVRRYHLTLNEVLHEKFFAGVSANAVEKVTGRLAREGWLAQHPFPRGRVYFTLSAQAARWLGEDPKIARAFGPQALARAYGVLAFCLRRRVTKFTREEFAELFPDLHEPGLPASSYYLDEEGGDRRLGMVIVDQGARVDRLARKVQETVERRARLPAFQKLIDERRFVVAVATSSPRKCADLTGALRELPPTNAWYRVEALPELIDLFPVAEGDRGEA
jgi:hypothetical protein